MRGTGRVVFAGVLLLIAGVINILYGIGALANASVFVNDTRFVLEDPQCPWLGSDLSSG